MQQRRHPIAFVQEDPLSNWFDGYLNWKNTQQTKRDRYLQALKTGTPINDIPPIAVEETKYNEAPIDNTNFDSLYQAPPKVRPATPSPEEYYATQNKMIDDQIRGARYRLDTKAPIQAQAQAQAQAKAQAQAQAPDLTGDDVFNPAATNLQVTDYTGQEGNPYQLGTLKAQRYNDAINRINPTQSPQSRANNLNMNQVKALAGALKSPIYKSAKELHWSGMTPSQAQDWIAKRGLPSAENPQYARLTGDFADLTDYERAERARMGLGTPISKQSSQEQNNKDFYKQYAGKSLTSPEFVQDNRDPTRIASIQARDNGPGVTARYTGLTTPAQGYDKVGQGYRVAPTQSAQSPHRNLNLQDNKPVTAPALGTKPKKQDNGFFTI